MLNLKKACSILKLDLKKKKTTTKMHLTKLNEQLVKKLNEFSLIEFYKIDYHAKLIILKFNQGGQNCNSIKALAFFFKKKRKSAIKYSQLKSLVKHNSRTIYLVMTSKGLVTCHEALIKKIGGILLLKIVV